MERQETEKDESIPVTQGGASPGLDTPAHSDSPMLFEFVTNDGNRRSQIRRHAMRESWRQRNRTNSPTTYTTSPMARGLREILPRVTQTQSSSRTGTDAEVSESEDVEMGEDLGRPSDSLYSSGDETLARETVKRERPLTSDAVFLDLRHTMATISEPNELSTTWSLSNIPACSGQRPSPYQSISDAEIDPFNSLRLYREDKELLHHWVHTYAHKAYGVPTDPVFDPIRNLFVAIDLAQPAFVHASLTHSASHVTYLRQERNNSIHAITHKMAAIRIINQSLNDPVEAISDETFSAVCRLLTFERYWGTEPGWRLHRRGLIQMIKKMGGLSTFQSNWRLELRVHLISLMSKPRWNKPAFASPEQNLEYPPTSANILDILQDYEMPHSNFVNFFSEVITISQETTQYPAIERAVTLLRSQPNQPGQEIARLMCLFYIAVIFRHAHRSHYDLSWLNDSLAMTELIWSNIVETLRWLLLQGMGRGPEVPESLARTEKLAEVASLLKENSWRHLQDRYCSLLLDGSPNGRESAPLNSSIFVSGGDD